MRLRFCLAVLTLLCAPVFHAMPAHGQTSASDPDSADAIDLDPLRRYIPRADIFMPIPGGVSALTRPPAGSAHTIEEQAAQMHGGLIIGYCLKASCRYVTHLVVLQVCNNQIGGPDGSDYLTLAVVRLPYGNKPGFLKSLQGRDYAYNFRAYGPYEQSLPLGSASNKVEALYAMAADGAGPIAPLDYLGQTPNPQQSPETLALLATMFKNADGVPYPHFQVRHLCQQPIS
ncbi:MAG: hypothetical protein HC871_05995 [Rhizobiales bacterium]|nr:hypothetical protein [Hyphomicrobiales bacterium]